MLTQTTALRTRGGPEAFKSTRIFKKCCVKLARMAGTSHLENALGAALPNRHEGLPYPMRDCPTQSP